LCLYVFGIFFDVKRKAFLFRIVDQFIYIISILIIVICYVCRIIFCKKENKWGIYSKLDPHEPWTDIYEHFWMNAYNFVHDHNAPPVFLFNFPKLQSLKLLALGIALLKFLALVYGRSFF
jgi:hypothetical protein